MQNMTTLDIERLKEVAKFLKDGEGYDVTMDDIEISMLQGKQWLWVGMKWGNFRTGKNLDHPMQSEGNIEYWIFHILKKVKELLKEDYETNQT